MPCLQPFRDDLPQTLLYKIASCIAASEAGDVASFNGRSGAVVLLFSDVTSALGFTPAAAGSGVTSFNTRTGAVTLTVGDVSAVADARYVLKAGDTMTGPLNMTEGQSYQYGGVNVIRAQTVLGNYFFGPGGNLTMTGNTNSTLGYFPLVANTTGSANTAIGGITLQNNTTGGGNSTLGFGGLADNISGNNNTTVGLFSGLGITTGSNNTILGANVVGLPSALSNNIILADGAGVIRLQVDSTGLVTTGAISANNGTLTVASVPVLTLGQTWNNAGVAFTAFLTNVTNTAAAAGSLLFDVQQNAATVFNLRTDGRLILNGRAAFTTTSSTGHILATLDALNTAAPTVLNLSHQLTGGVAAAGMGVTIDQNADSTTTVLTRMSRWQTQWTDATHATRSASTTFLSFSAGAEVVNAVFGAGGIQTGTVGTAALPSITFRSDLDTGIFFNSANDLFISSGGVQVAAFTDTTGIILSTSLALPYVAKTATYTASAVDYTIDCTANTFTVNLPTAVGITGRIYVIKNSGVGTITVDPSGAQTIDSLATATVVSGASITTQSNGANWIII